MLRVNGVELLNLAHLREVLVAPSTGSYVSHTWVWPWGSYSAIRATPIICLNTQWIWMELKKIRKKMSRRSTRQWIKLALLTVFTHFFQTGPVRARGWACHGGWQGDGGSGRGWHCCEVPHTHTCGIGWFSIIFTIDLIVGRSGYTHVQSLIIHNVLLVQCAGYTWYQAYYAFINCVIMRPDAWWLTT